MAKRRKFSGKHKVEILRRHLLEGQSISDVCDEYDLNPNLFYRWLTPDPAVRSSLWGTEQQKLSLGGMR